MEKCSSGNDVHQVSPHEQSRNYQQQGCKSKTRAGEAFRACARDQSRWNRSRLLQFFQSQNQGQQPQTTPLLATEVLTAEAASSVLLLMPCISDTKNLACSNH